MSINQGPSTPLVDAVRRTHTATPVGVALTPDASLPDATTQPKSRTQRGSRGRAGRPARRTIRIAVLLGIMAICGVWLMRNGGLTVLLKQADSTATELATTNSTAADALNLLGFSYIRSAAGLPPICDIHHPSFLYGFASLKVQIGAPMGDPLECERAIHPSGDTHQLTSTGLAYYRKGVNIPSFVAGEDHWALTARGLVHWIGDVVDPPGTALP